LDDPRLREVSSLWKNPAGNAKREIVVLIEPSLVDHNSFISWENLPEPPTEVWHGTLIPVTTPNLPPLMARIGGREEVHGAKADVSQHEKGINSQVEPIPDLLKLAGLSALRPAPWGRFPADIPP
jgi:hypothetical protein